MSLLPNVRRPLLAALLLTTPWYGLAPAALANDEPRWYQVELIAFARRTADDGQEHWPQNLQLRYPQRWEVVRDPNAELEEPHEEATFPVTGNDPVSASYTTTPAEPVDLSRDPFYQLPSQERQLNRYATALQRDSRYRVLLHQAWRQPIQSSQQTPALLIRGGDNYGSHYELEGSIQLQLSRFLHIQTALWYTRFEANYGQHPDAWPTLPHWPDQPQADVTPANQALQGSDTFTLGGGSNPWDMDLNQMYLSDMPSALGEPYLPNRIVILEQSRRMRSNELHYLDHPLFGLIVQITPYDLPDSIATAQ